MGVPIGVSNLHYAILTSDTAGGVTYGTPVEIPGITSINITPNPDINAMLSGKKAQMQRACELGLIEVEIDASDIDLAIQAIWLGHTVSGGKMTLNAEDEAPDIAIGFKTVKSDGTFRYIWLYKGRFREPTVSHVTRGATITYAVPKLIGSFMSRDYDGNWQVSAEDGLAGWTASVGTNWFNAVQ